MKRTFKVSGMKCMGCVGNVFKSLESLEGVSIAEAQLATGLALVEGDAPSERIIEALATAGYPGEEVGE